MSRGYKPIEWADIARMNRPPTRILPQQVQERVTNAKRLLGQKYITLVD